MPNWDIQAGMSLIHNKFQKFIVLIVNPTIIFIETIRLDIWIKSQMYCQPLYAMVDKWFDEQQFDNTFVTIKYTLKLPLLPSLSLNLQRVCSRTAYVASTTLVALIFPYFNEVLGVLGATNFWPLAIYFPVEMCLRRKNIESWTSNWILLRSFSLVCFILTVFAFVASIEGLVAARLGSGLKIYH